MPTELYFKRKYLILNFKGNLYFVEILAKFVKFNLYYSLTEVAFNSK